MLSGGIERLNLASAGFLSKAEGATTQVTPILVTSPQAMQIPAEKFSGAPDPVGPAARLQARRQAPDAGRTHRGYRQQRLSRRHAQTRARQAEGDDKAKQDGTTPEQPSRMRPRTPSPKTTSRLRQRTPSQGHSPRNKSKGDKPLPQRTPSPKMTSPLRQRTPRPRERRRSRPSRIRRRAASTLSSWPIPTCWRTSSGSTCASSSASKWPSPTPATRPSWSRRSTTCRARMP